MVKKKKRRVSIENIWLKKERVRVVCNEVWSRDEYAGKLKPQ